MVVVYAVKRPVCSRDIEVQIFSTILLLTKQTHMKRIAILILAAVVVAIGIVGFTKKSDAPKPDQFLTELAAAKNATDNFVSLYNANSPGAEAAFYAMQSAFAELNKYNDVAAELNTRRPFIPVPTYCQYNCIVEYRDCMKGGGWPMGEVQALCTSGYYSCWYYCSRNN
jgi:hypothetical protein